MAHSHMMYVMFQLFRSKIEEFKCPNLKSLMQDLAKVIAIHELTNNDSSSVYESGHFAMGTGSSLMEAYKKLLVKLRPQFIPLIESWEIPDTQLVSAIGNSYGDIYET